MVEPGKSHRERAEQALGTMSGVPQSMVQGSYERAKIEALLALGDEIATLREAVRDLVGTVDGLRP